VSQRGSDWVGDRHGRHRLVAAERRYGPSRVEPDEIWLVDAYL
jgi:hypothetical protein